MKCQNVKKSKRKHHGRFGISTDTAVDGWNNNLEYNSKKNNKKIRKGTKKKAFNCAKETAWYLRFYFMKEIHKRNCASLSAQYTVNCEVATQSKFKNIKNCIHMLLKRKLEINKRINFLFYYYSEKRDEQ